MGRGTAELANAGVGLAILLGLALGRGWGHGERAAQAGQTPLRLAYFPNLTHAPALIGVVPSIEFVIGVAVGGRASLAGPALGAIAVAWARTALSERAPSAWVYFEGLLFILPIVFLPGGIASLASYVRRKRDRSVGA